jgi:hypothetical protein
MPEICKQCGKEHATLEELQAKEKPPEEPKRLRIKKRE